jgi:hypothetical protein
MHSLWFIPPLSSWKFSKSNWGNFTNNHCDSTLKTIFRLFFLTILLHKDNSSSILKATFRQFGATLFTSFKTTIQKLTWLFYTLSACNLIIMLHRWENQKEPQKNRQTWIILTVFRLSLYETQLVILKSRFVGDGGFCCPNQLLNANILNKTSFNPLPDGPLFPPLSDGPRSDWT